MDAAALLERYRRAGLSFASLNGTLIIIIHDPNHGTCHIVRDRIGECCAYYIGSRVFNYVRDAGAPLSWRGTLTGPECTSWNEVSQVPPAHILTIDLGTGEHRLARYWNPLRARSDGGPWPERMVGCYDDRRRQENCRWCCALR